MVFDEGKGRSSETDIDVTGLRLGANRIVNGVEAYQAVNEVVINKKKRETL